MASVIAEEPTTTTMIQEERKQKDEVPGDGGGGGGGSQENEPKQQQLPTQSQTPPVISTSSVASAAQAVAGLANQQTPTMMTTTTTTSPPITPSRAAGQVPIQTIPIETKCGIITAHVQGDLEQMENRGVFLTVHDIGSNSRTFLEFTEHPIMSAIKLRSLFIHVDLIGQQDNQSDLPEDYEFPPIKTIGEELLVEVLDKLKIKLIVGIGEGAGANILVRFANKYHSRVLGLVLIHLAPAGVGVLERLKSQISTGKRRFSEFSAENIIELHRLGDSSGRSGQSSPPPQSEQQQLMPLYSNRVNQLNAKNIKRYAISYMNRKELPLLKDMDILLVAGSRSPYLNGTQKYFAQCDKEKTSFLKVDHVVDVLTEAPEKLAKSILLFVKGLGFLTSLTLPGIDRQRTLSGSSQSSNDESGATMGPVPNIKPHRILERRRTLSMEEYDMPRPRRLISAQSFQSSSLGRSASHRPVKPSPLATKTN